MEFLLLAKINFVFQIVEKSIYAGIVLFSGKVAVRYVKDYKQSIEDEDYVKQR